MSKHKNINNYICKINDKINNIKSKENIKIKDIIKKNNLSTNIKNFFNNNFRINKQYIVFINGKFACNKDEIAKYIIKKPSFKSIIIDFYDIIDSYCKIKNIPINKILFLFFTFNNNSKGFIMASNLFVDYFYKYIKDIYSEYKVLIIKGYLFNKRIFLKINYLFDIYNIFLINEDIEKYSFNIAKKIYYDNKLNTFSKNLHKFFFGKNNLNYNNMLLNVIKTNNFEKNEIYFIIENYINSPKFDEHLFFSFYKNNFNKHNSIVSV
jgi:hypothetical protein